MKTKAAYRAGRHVDEIIGISPWAECIRSEILRVAGHDSNVLITGPSGTGKELIARALRTYGRRAEGPFVPVDCAALPAELFVSQMFGHLKGAFTGAHYAAMGAFRAADRGTILLDEIGELDPAIQARLLRVIQEKMVVPLGSHKGLPVDVRIVAATNRDLKAEVRAGRFREDLYYRLNVISLKTVPLKERPQDIAVLAGHFLHKLVIDAGLPLKRLSPGVINLLCSYDWPGNVRELNNHLERAVVCSEDEVLGAESMPELLEAVMAGGPTQQPHPTGSGERRCEPPAEPPPDRRPSQPVLAEKEHWPSMAEVERGHILFTLEHTFYNQCAAARILQMDRHALRRKIKKYGLDVSQSKRGRPPAGQPSCIARRPR